MEIKKDMLTAEDVARELNVSIQTARRYGEQGKIKKVSYSKGTVRYTRKSVLKLKMAS